MSSGKVSERAGEDEWVVGRDRRVVLMFVGHTCHTGSTGQTGPAQADKKNKLWFSDFVAWV